MQYILNYLLILFQAPPKSLVDKYLDAIAKTYNVPFEPEPDAEEAGEEFGGGEGGGGLIDFSESAPPMQPNVEKKETFMYPPPTTSVRIYLYLQTVSLYKLRYC